VRLHVDAAIVLKYSELSPFGVYYYHNRLLK
jgi:hypothetical protein